MLKYYFFISLLFSLAAKAASPPIPYLLKLSDTKAEIRWESTEEYHLNISSPSSSVLNYSPEHIFTKYRIGKKPAKLYRVMANNLSAGETYFYELKNDSGSTGIFRFKTLSPENKAFSFLLVSDSQRGAKLSEDIVNKSILPNVFFNSEERKKSPVHFFLFPGDLVQRGFRHSLWRKQFFSPLRNILNRVPIVAAIGNHEYNSRFFWNYFYNGKIDDEPKYFDQLSSRFITLSSTIGRRKRSQLEWLNLTLNNAKDRGIKFIFLQYHHPATSEVWPRGEKKYSKKIESVVNLFSQDFEGHIIIINGHTHAYSRGHQSNIRVTNIIAGPLGGKIDYWKRSSKDYEHMMINSSTSGWSIFDVKENQVTHKYYSYDQNFNETKLVDSYTLNYKKMTPNIPKVNFVKKLKRGIAISLENKDYLSIEVTLLTIKDKVTFTINERNDQQGFIVKNNLSNLLINSGKKLTDQVTSIKVRARNKNLEWSKLTNRIEVD
jgi:acid phosphatase type 7